ncbi:MAG: hypothetical protein NTW19_15095 [Planctomycetota bacterium]|nr:hypothetical protein [Planctomycetota bacterium]
MVALLILRYKVNQSMPENAVAFFGDLFVLLLQRHDKQKPGYIRPRKSKIGDIGLHDTFCAISYLSRKSDGNSIPLTQLYGFCREALKLVALTDHAVAVVEDIKNITCLVLEEGGDCRFIHKGVQEYHAACFVRQQSEDSGRKFYEAMVRYWRSWRQELYFLETIDDYRFTRYFLIPQLKSVLGLPDIVPVEWKASLEGSRRLSADTVVGFALTGSAGVRITTITAGDQWGWPVGDDIRGYFDSIAYMKWALHEELIRKIGKKSDHRSVGKGEEYVQVKIRYSN